MKRYAVLMSAAVTVGGLVIPAAWAADPVSPASPAQTDNQLNPSRENRRDATNNANDAVNNGAAAVDNAARSAANAVERTGDNVRSGVGQATAGTPSADNPAPDAKDIRKALGRLGEDALTKGGLNKVVNHFVDADRNRLKKSDTYDQDFGDKLDGRIEQINQAWKTKFGHSFNVKSSEDAFSNFAMIRQGQIGRDAVLAAEVIRNSQKANMSDKDNAAGNDRKDENLETGRQIAVLTVGNTPAVPEGAAQTAAAKMGAAELKVPLIHEMPDAWTINVPDTLTAAKLRQNLLDHLTMMGEKPDQWSADENAAIREITRHVLAAVLDQPMASGASGEGAAK